MCMQLLSTMVFTLKWQIVIYFPVTLETMAARLCQDREFDAVIAQAELLAQCALVSADATIKTLMMTTFGGETSSVPLACRDTSSLRAFCLRQ